MESNFNLIMHTLGARETWVAFSSRGARHNEAILYLTYITRLALFDSLLASGPL